MSRLRRSLVINFLSSSGANLLQFIVSILLARILSPSEIGVYSIAFVFVNIAHMFRDFGVSSYLQSQPTLSREQLRSAMGMMFTSTWLIALILFLLSGPISLWFHEPPIAPIIQILAVGFLLIPFGAITNSMLLRELAADKQAIVSAASTVSYCASCLGLATLGLGTMSIAWANLISGLVTALACIPFRPKNMPWLPSFRNMRGIANFGAGTLLANCVNAINVSIPDILLGKLGNARAVGLFSRANSTVSIFTYIAGSTISYGALSYMSQVHHRGEPLAPMLQRATALITGIGWPAYALTALLGHDIVATLYGDKWLGCVPAIMPLALAAGVSMLFQYTQYALTAIGRPYLSAVPISVTLFSRIIFGYVLYDGQLVTFAWAMLVAAVAAAPVVMLQQRKYLHFGALQLLESTKGSLIVTIICMAGCEGMKLLLPDTLKPIIRLSILLVPLMLIWYVALRVTRHEMLEEVHHIIAGFRARLPGFN